MPDVVMELLGEYKEQYVAKRNALGTAWAVDVRTVAGRLEHSQTSTTLDIYSRPLKSMDEVASSKLELVLGEDKKE